MDSERDRAPRCRRRDPEEEEEQEGGLFKAEEEEEEKEGVGYSNEEEFICIQWQVQRDPGRLLPS